MRLVRSDEGERMARMLESAYTALQTRDIEAARAIYEQVLALDPNNTDALAGLATYSARAGNPLQAERLFNQVLAIDPNDQAARAGLVALRTSGDPAGQESQLRHLIAQDDSQPALHYALGNVLAAQGRWAEAQQSYFIATAGDAEQPDYAYNLAVSLERLKQPRAAATHYRRALELAVSRPARFPIDRARARLTALDGAARQGD
ncbi:MAG TPA: tetratricopeptide repeat protein [Burkholderiaceae bacterium]|nr:tetratricopeptide repeat protein [Burkholderiaceae bacterium]